SLLLACRETPGRTRTGVELLGGARPVLLRRANSQRATMQAPQGLDAQHRGELFPVNESYAAPQSLSRRELFARDAAKPASRNSGKTRGGQGRGRNFRRCETRPPPQSKQPTRNNADATSATPRRAVSRQRELRCSLRCPPRACLLPHLFGHCRHCLAIGCAVL